jgi:hypothetical protein
MPIRKFSKLGNYANKKIMQIRKFMQFRKILKIFKLCKLENDAN